MVGAPIPESFRQTIRELVERDGERLATAKLRLTRTSLARALAGLPVYAGTHALIWQQVEALSTREAVTARR